MFLFFLFPFIYVSLFTLGECRKYIITWTKKTTMEKFKSEKRNYVVQRKKKALIKLAGLREIWNQWNFKIKQHNLFCGGIQLYPSMPAFSHFCMHEHANIIKSCMLTFDFCRHIPNCTHWRKHVSLSNCICNNNCPFYWGTWSRSTVHFKNSISKFTFRSKLFCTTNTADDIPQRR